MENYEFKEENEELERKRTVGYFIKFLERNEFKIMNFKVKAKYPDGRMDIDVSLPKKEDIDNLVQKYLEFLKEE